jgi:hypothetical protein
VARWGVAGFIVREGPRGNEISRVLEHVDRDGGLLRCFAKVKSRAQPRIANPSPQTARSFNRQEIFRPPKLFECARNRRQFRMCQMSHLKIDNSPNASLTFKFKRDLGVV